MKSIIPILLVPLLLASCQNPADTARLGALADLAITYAARKGQISVEDAAAIREAKTIILPSASAALDPLGKAPLANLQP
jgi:hypothetical protein